MVAGRARTRLRGQHPVPHRPQNPPQRTHRRTVDDPGRKPPAGVGDQPVDDDGPFRLQRNKRPGAFAFPDVSRALDVGPASLPAWSGAGLDGPGFDADGITAVRRRERHVQDLAVQVDARRHRLDLGGEHPGHELVEVRRSVDHVADQDQRRLDHAQAATLRNAPTRVPSGHPPLPDRRQVPRRRAAAETFPWRVWRRSEVDFARIHRLCWSDQHRTGQQSACRSCHAVERHCRRAGVPACSAVRPPRCYPPADRVESTGGGRLRSARKRPK